MSKTPLPAQGEGKRGEGGYLGYLLRQAANAYRGRVETALRDLRLTPPQFTALTMLDAYPDHSGADLARVALLTPQTMSTILQNLEKAGLIRRRPNPDHGRKQQIELTETGQHMLREAKSRVYALETDLAQGFSAAEQATLRRWLATVARGASHSPSTSAIE